MKPAIILFFTFLPASCQATPERTAINAVVEANAPKPFNANNMITETGPDASPVNAETIVVEIYGSDKVRLHWGAAQPEEMGTVSDLSKLTRRLTDIFKHRKSRTVFVKAPRETVYKNVAKVIDAAKVTGAEPIGLQVDDVKE
jgi:biopolymer transport protein ExbD